MQNFIKLLIFKKIACQTNVIKKMSIVFKKPFYFFNFLQIIISYLNLFNLKFYSNNNYSYFYIYNFF